MLFANYTQFLLSNNLVILTYYDIDSMDDNIYNWTFDDISLIYILLN